MDKKTKKKISIRQDTMKTSMVEQLKKTPIVQIACEKVEISRATYYRWRTDDKAFAESADAAIAEGSLLINDLAESQLVSAIRDKNFGAVVFWLKHHHRAYTTKVEINANIKQLIEELTPEQEKVIEEALRLVALSSPDVNDSIQNESKQQKQNELSSRENNKGPENQDSIGKTEPPAIPEHLS